MDTRMKLMDSATSKKMWRRKKGIAGRACETWWLGGREKGDKIDGLDRPLKNLQMIGWCEW